MKDVKLTDFTKYELQTLLDALAVHRATIQVKKMYNEAYDAKELDRIDLLVTQVINAKVEVRMCERITLN